MEDRDDIFGPHNTVVVFDLHHVLCQPNYSNMLLHIITDEQFWAKFSLVVCDPFFLFSSLYSLVLGEHIEKTVLKVQSRYGKEIHQLFSLVTEISNCQEIQLELIEIILRLKEKGYKVYIFSNISRRFFNHLKAKYPQTFDIFDGIYTTDETTDYLQKPSPESFMNFLEKFVPDESHQVIFVDDSIRNVEMAKDMGMFGILYRNVRNLGKHLDNLLPLDM